MSDWTANPFADSEKPAAPPRGAPSTQQPEYNPFDGDKGNHGAAAFGKKKGGEDTSPDWATPAPPPRHDAPPAPQSQPTTTTTTTSTTTNTSSSWTSRFTRKETPKEAEPAPQDLQRQQEYQEREAMARGQLKDPSLGRPANFPPFPKWMRWGPFQPCFHLDIQGEIPLYGRRIVRIAFFTWGFTFVCLFWNFIATLSSLACSSCSGTSTSCVLATFWLVLFAPCSYCCWFNPLYNAVRQDSSFKFGWFFFVMTFQVVTSAFMAAGFPSTGGAGLWVGANVVDHDKIAGVIIFTSAIMWILNCLICVFILQRVLRLYRSTGGSMQKAQGEMIVGVASNKTVQGAVVKGVTQQQTY